MSILGTFNSWTVISVPSVPVAQSVEWGIQDTVGISQNPFNLSQQIFDWGASRLSATVSMPPMKDNYARAWVAFLMQCHGPANVFSFGDPLAIAPLGTPLGTPVVNGGGQSGYVLSTSGWTASTNNLLLPGDWMQIGNRIYRNLDVVNSNSSGIASHNIWPQLRETPTASESIVLTNTTGMFRLSSTDRKYSMAETKVYGLSFDMQEAL